MLCYRLGSGYMCGYFGCGVHSFSFKSVRHYFCWPFILYDSKWEAISANRITILDWVRLEYRPSHEYKDRLMSTKWLLWAHKRVYRALVCQTSKQLEWERKWILYSNPYRKDCLNYAKNNCNQFAFG